jgi:predicted Zn-dependent peptidase
MEYQSHILGNGIRLLHIHKKSPVAYCGFIINTGSRDELKSEQGIAHFIEHTIFKGTKKRKPFHIINRMESVGGELDAYTTKEETWVYTTFLSKYYERSIELISDIVFNSVFPEKEIEKEKIVVLDEINSYKDTPAEQIFDDFEEIIFKDHPIGRNILGNSKSISQFKQKDIQKFIQNNYHTDQMILCSVGEIDFEKLKKQFIKYFNPVTRVNRTRKRAAFKNYTPQVKKIVYNTFQSHCILGNLAYSAKDKKRLGLLLLNNILGGPGMNSRLNMTLREKHGLVYHVESNYNRYSDTGAWNIYFGTDKENVERCLSLVNKELQNLKNKKLGTIQLHNAKQQMIGQIAISSDNSLNQLFALGKSFLLYNKLDSLDSVYKKIDKLKSDQVIEIANEIYDQSKISTLIFE